jgi:hypothetical protein
MTKKKKKQKKPNIPIQTLARPRLERNLERRQRGELDDEVYIGSIEALMKEIGAEAVLNALVGLLENADNERKDALMAAIPKLGDDKTIKHLWQLVRRSKISVGGKMTALIILKQMGEEVDLENPGKYFSWRDIKKADIAEVANLGRFSMQALIKELQHLKSVDEVEAMMLQFEGITRQSGGEMTAQAIVDDLVEMGDSGAADMLAAISATTSYSKVRQAARAGLMKLSAQKIFPQNASVKSLRDERFYAAYSTDPANPWQQQVAILFERGANMVQALVFLLDFGHPWRGSIKDMFPTQSMPVNRFQREFIDRANQQDIEQRRVPYARARRFILDAVAANRKYGVRLPPEFDEFRALIERRVIDPSPETLAYAEEVDARSVDEWGEMEGEPVRGMEIIGPDGKAIPIMVFGDLDEAAWNDEPYTFDDLMAEVNDYYQVEDEEDLDEEAIPFDWVIGYLETRYNQNISVEELEARWDDLCDFMFYLSGDDEAPAELAEVQGYHLSEFITDFWDEEMERGAETPLDEKRHVIETIRDFYTYLAQQSYISSEASQNVTKAAAALFSQPHRLTPIHE